MIKLLNLPYKIILHYHTLGFQGVLLLFKRNISKFKYFDILLPKYPYSVRLRNNTSDITVFYQVFLAKSYLFNLKRKPNVIIDCGANIGLSTVFFKNRFPNAKIIAIEPEESNFEMLLANTKNYNDVYCIKSGIWNKTANLEVKKGQGNWGFFVEEVDYESTNTVPAISINEIINKYKIEEIDILKIDIEGSEKEVFEDDFENWLSKTNVLVIELHDGLKPGASKTFFNAISKYDFNMSKKDENLIFYLKNEK